jgi:hypothetical protein
MDGSAELTHQIIRDLAAKWTRERRHFLNLARKRPDEGPRWEGAALAITKCRSELLALLHEVGPASQETNSGTGAEAA